MASEGSFTVLVVNGRAWVSVTVCFLITGSCVAVGDAAPAVVGGAVVGDAAPAVVGGAVVGATSDQVVAGVGCGSDWVDAGSQADRSNTARATATVGPVLIRHHPLRGRKRGKAVVRCLESSCPGYITVTV